MKKYNIPFSPPDICEDEVQEVCAALRSGWITTGPKTKLFEKELADFCQTENMVCLNSATACMEMTLRLLGVGPGDEVIVPAYTYTASCSVICHVGATPVIIDSQKDKLEMDYGKVAAAINEKTKVIIPVDIAGILCDYDKLLSILEEKRFIFKPANDIQKDIHRVVVLSDCAHGFGAQRNRKLAGSFADFTCYSFHAVKNLTTAEGGAVTWKPIHGIENEWIYKQYQLLSLHGQTKDALSKNKIGAWEYDIVSPAYKCNMTDILAAVGRIQLKRYPALLKRRHELISLYDERLRHENVRILEHHSDHHLSSGHLYMVRVHNITLEQRNQIIMEMAEKGVACNVHYKPLPLLTAYKNFGFNIEDYPNAYAYYKNEITLPLYSTMSNEEANYVIDCFLDVLRGYR